ncbi:hypothetical protein CAPTEDRAFT_207905 [Capitella teleta]|uniref:Galaxin-like repeats domain-containing protein n=1 Tax=Capitella teleta TaxID=283909 RepID=R7VFH9_CAPTE|nr:hypothetical protein CAPTEDRAFT_207905 [Capitella teleta]|eukprot:ELU17598.1 hypothetical protein CAPTEDRAFT_207905 [Capitella teleta]
MKSFFALSLICLASAELKNCGSEFFDNDDFMCCNGVVSPRPDCSERVNHECCGTVGFDNGANQCCFGRIQLRQGERENNKCCAHQRRFNYWVMELQNAPKALHGASNVGMV